METSGLERGCPSFERAPDSRHDRAGTCLGFATPVDSYLGRCGVSHSDRGLACPYLGLAAARPRRLRMRRNDRRMWRPKWLSARYLGLVETRRASVDV